MHISHVNKNGKNLQNSKIFSVRGGVTYINLSGIKKYALGSQLW